MSLYPLTMDQMEVARRMPSHNLGGHHDAGNINADTVNVLLLRILQFTLVCTCMFLIITEWYHLEIDQLEQRARSHLSHHKLELDMAFQLCATDLPTRAPDARIVFEREARKYFRNKIKIQA